MLKLFGANPGADLVTGIVLVGFGLVAHAYLLAGAGGFVVVMSVARVVGGRGSHQSANRDRHDVRPGGRR